MSSIKLLHDWYERVWVSQDLDAIDALFSPDAEALGMIGFAVGPDDFRVLAEAVLAQISVKEVRFDREVEMGNWAWASFTARAQSLATGEEMETTGQIMARVDNGKIVEAYNQVDFLTLLEQLNYVPKDTLALCLSGEGVGL